MPNIAGGVDTLSFHWPRSSLPVKVWAEDALNLPSHTRRGLDQWEEAFLYGEFAAVVVSDSSTADVIVRNGLASKGDLNVTRLESHFAPSAKVAPISSYRRMGNRSSSPSESSSSRDSIQPLPAWTSAWR